MARHRIALASVGHNRQPAAHGIDACARGFSWPWQAFRLSRLDSSTHHRTMGSHVLVPLYVEHTTGSSEEFAREARELKRRIVAGRHLRLALPHP